MTRGTVITTPSASDLVSVCLSVLQRLLTQATRRKCWHTHKTSLTHYIHGHLPHNLRQRLQERILADWRVYDTVTLRLLELLFSSTTTSLELIHVRTFYRDAFVNLLPRLTGLQHLKIQDPVWSLSRRQLEVTTLSLSKMAYLRVLTLQYCGHDALLAAAGGHCPHLQVVDMIGAREVTDEGVWALVTSRPNNWSSCISREEKKKKMALSLGRCWGAAFRSITSKLLTALIEPADPELMKHSRPEDEPDEISWSDCTKSLVLVDLRCTKVTPMGISILRQTICPNAIVKHDNFYILRNDDELDRI